LAIPSPKILTRKISEKWYLGVKNQKIWCRKKIGVRKRKNFDVKKIGVKKQKFWFKKLM